MAKIFVKLQSPVIELKVTGRDGSGNTDSFTAGYKRYELDEAQKKLETLKTFNERKEEKEVEKFLVNEIVYLKNVSIEYETDEGVSKKLTISDTRQAKPVETLWESPDECLAVLLEAYMASAPYSVSFVENLYKALLNRDFEEDKIKNS